MIIKNLFKKNLEILRIMKSGWHSGKGFKSLKHNNYNKSIEHLKLALKYSDNEIEPVLFDNMSIAYYKLNEQNKAIELAQESIRQYLLTNKNDERIINRIKDLENMIISIRNNV